MNLSSCRRSVAPFASMLALTLAPLATAQSGLAVPAPSPKARVEQQVGITDLAVDYSSPGVKGRKIWGALVPYGQIWRAGANAPTKLTASREFTFGGKKIPAGSYVLLAIPNPASWTIVLSGDPEASAFNYDAKKDLARVEVKPQSLPTARERLTYVFSDTTDDATQLDLEWEKLRVRIPLKVDTSAQVQAGIERAVEDAWRPHFTAARYLLESNGDLKRALEYANASIEIKPTWWNHWIKAQILGKTGNAREAIATANKAKALGKGDSVYERFFAPQIDAAVKGWK